MMRHLYWLVLACGCPLFGGGSGEEPQSVEQVGHDGGEPSLCQDWSLTPDVCRPDQWVSNGECDCGCPFVDPECAPAQCRLGGCRETPVKLEKEEPLDPGITGEYTAEVVPGVWYARRPGLDPLDKIHILAIDVTRQNLSLLATPWENRGMRTRDFGELFSCVAAINGDYCAQPACGGDLQVLGPAIARGNPWPATHAYAGSDEFRQVCGYLAYGNGRADMMMGNVPRERWMAEVVGGCPLLVVEGVARSLEQIDADARSGYGINNMTSTHPRSAVGVSEGGEFVFLVAVAGHYLGDGSGRTGMNGIQLAELMAEIGAWWALNLDGGGSTALYLPSEAGDSACSSYGVVNVPSDTRDGACSMRYLPNHICVFQSP